MALEVTLEKMADRLARAELALLREQSLSRQAARRAAEAEAALERLRAAGGGLRNAPPFRGSRGAPPLR